MTTVRGSAQRTFTSYRCPRAAWATEHGNRRHSVVGKRVATTHVGPRASPPSRRSCCALARCASRACAFKVAWQFWPAARAIKLVRYASESARDGRGHSRERVLASHADTARARRPLVLGLAQPARALGGGARATRSARAIGHVVCARPRPQARCAVVPAGSSAHDAIWERAHHEPVQAPAASAALERRRPAASLERRRPAAALHRCRPASGLDVGRCTSTIDAG